MAFDRRRVKRELPEFLRAYARTSRRPSADPNDRHYSHRLAGIVKRLPPEDLDRLMREEDEDEAPSDSN